MNPFEMFEDFIGDSFRGSRLKQAIIGYVTLAGLFTPDGSVPVSSVKEHLGISDAQWEYEIQRLAADADVWLTRDGNVICGLIYDLAKFSVGGVSGRPSASAWKALREQAHAEMFEHMEPHCMGCGREGVPLALDHTVPVSRGGSNHPMNFMWLCVPCNSSKGTKTWEEWRRALGEN